MNKYIATLLAGLCALAMTTAALAHSSGRSGIHGSISLGIPIGHHGYAVVGAGIPFGQSQHGYSAYGHWPGCGHGYGPGYRQGYGHKNYGHGYRRGSSHYNRHDKGHGRGRGHDRGHDRSRRGRH